jgi:hypothetical protein
MTTSGIRHPLDCKRGRPLSARNHEVGRLFARGLTEPELVVSVNTVEYHLKRLKAHFARGMEVTFHSHGAFVLFLRQVYGNGEG